MLVVTALPNVRLWLWLGSVITSLAVHGGGKVAELEGGQPGASSRGQATRPWTSDQHTADSRLELQTSHRRSYIITEKASTKAFS